MKQVLNATQAKIGLETPLQSAVETQNEYTADGIAPVLNATLSKISFERWVLNAVQSAVAPQNKTSTPWMESHHSCRSEACARRRQVPR